jgi:release factor glutamine methyltransferase
MKMTFAEAETTFITQLKSVYDSSEAKEIAFHVIHHLTGISKSEFFLNKQRLVNDAHKNSFMELIDELKEGKPLQYILGETQFYGLPFKVNPSVLIPRPETEELVDWVLKSLKPETGSLRSDLHSQTSIPKILDIGTGSGCIAISLKKHLLQAKVDAVDKFIDALKTAESNAILNQTEINFVQADILKEPELVSDTDYSIVISNPPYITPAEKNDMHANVLDYEPHSALFIPEENPLIFYHHITAFAKAHLINGGLLFFEINESFGKEIVEFLENEGFNNVELRKDLQGKDRMVKSEFRR